MSTTKHLRQISTGGSQELDHNSGPEYINLTTTPFLKISSLPLCQRLQEPLPSFQPFLEKNKQKKNFHKATRVTKIEAQVKHKYVILKKIFLHAKNMTLNIGMLTNI